MFDPSANALLGIKKIERPKVQTQKQLHINVDENTQ